MPNLDHTRITASLTAYLEELHESGIDGLPNGGTTDVMSIEINSPKAGITSEKKISTAVGTTEDSHHETPGTIRKSLGDCQRCKLSKSRNKIVFGSGNPQAKIMFVGEGPGADEDASGEPFVGEAGGILTRIINAMGLVRDDVYICNVVKCRPPGNRNPEPDEIAACSPFLLRQIHSVNPQVIVALGKCATHALLSSKEPISKMRGKFHDYCGTPLMPTFHPSYLLHNKGNKELFWDVWDDMTQVLRLVGLPVPEKSRK